MIYTDGFIIQKGTTAGNVSNAFTISFKNVPNVIGIVYKEASSYAYTASIQSLSKTNVSFVTRYTNENTSGLASETIYYIAMGY